MLVMSPAQLKSHLIGQCYFYSRSCSGKMRDWIQAEGGDEAYDYLKRLSGYAGLLEIFGEIRLLYVVDRTIHHYIPLDDAKEMFNTILLNPILKDRLEFPTKFIVDIPQSETEFHSLTDVKEVGILCRAKSLQSQGVTEETFKKKDRSFHEAQRSKAKAKKKAKQAKRLEGIQQSVDTVKPNLVAGKRMLCIDVEAFEHDTKKITEIGCCVVEGIRVIHKHYIIEENQKYRNGKYVADNRDHYNFGESEILPLADIVTIMNDQIAKCDFMVGHAFRNDIQMLSSIGIPIGNAKYYDTAKIGKAILQVKKSTVGLKEVLERTNIEHSHLHNAGNDSSYTMAALLALVEQQDLLLTLNPKPCIM